MITETWNFHSDLGSCLQEKTTNKSIINTHFAWLSLPSHILSDFFHTCNTVVPGSTQTLCSSTNTSIFSGALAGVVAVARTFSKNRPPFRDEAATVLANDVRNIFNCCLFFLSNLPHQMIKLTQKKIDRSNCDLKDFLSIFLFPYKLRKFVLVSVRCLSSVFYRKKREKKYEPKFC